MTRNCLGLVVGASFAALLCVPAAALAQTAPSLGVAQSFGVLSGTASVSSTGPTVVNGDLGTSGVAGITGFLPGTYTGTLHNGDAVAAQAQLDAITGATSALVNLQGQGCNDSAGATILGPTTIGFGVHCYTSTLLINGPITLDAGGNPNAIFIFKIGSSLTTAVNSVIQLQNGAQACNVFWAVTQDATVEVGSTFVGNLLAGRDISVKTNAHMFGRALAGRAITLDSNTVDATVCAGAIPGGSGACVPGVVPPTITTIPSQVIPVLPVGGSVAVGFTISGAIITDALNVVATSSDTTLVPQSAMTITKGVGGARVLTIFGADGRSGVTTITVSVTDNSSGSSCTTSTSFRLTIGTAVPTLSDWAFVMLALLLTGGGVFTLRRRGQSGHDMTLTE
jgi:hypothetical protein